MNRSEVGMVGFGIVALIAMVVLVIIGLAVPISGLLWWLGYISMQDVVAVLVISVTLNIIFGGGE